MIDTDRGALITIPFVVLFAAGVAWAGSQGSYTFGGLPIFALGFLIAFLVQWLAFIPSFTRYSQAAYDLTGCITNITVILVSMLLTPELDTRSWLLAAMILIWAGRLGYFLVSRIRQDGEDRRFYQIEKSFSRFLLVWTMQGLWVALTLATGLAVITSTGKVPLDLFAIVGFLVWLTGFTLEVIADNQKRNFKADPENRDKFIHSGLWSWSRHPNYLGEILLWIGVALIALPVLKGWQWVTLISPLFVILLLTQISGIPTLETQADEKWGGQSDYETYKAETPVLLPRLPSNK